MIEIRIIRKPNETRAGRLRSRNNFADRVALLLYNETEPEAVTDIVGSIKNEGARTTDRWRGGGKR